MKFVRPVLMVGRRVADGNDPALGCAKAVNAAVAVLVEVKTQSKNPR